MFYALPEYPDLDTLIRAVLPQDQRDDIEKIVINYDSDVVQGLGAGGASTAKGATVYFKDEKTHQSVKIFMKCIPKEGQPAFYNNLLHIFDKEVTLYKKILPMLTEFTGTDELAKMVPECFGAGLINGDRIMCLRDFSADGFKTTGKKELHSLELIRTALEHLAKFHAPSLAMQALNGIDFPKEFGDAVKDFLPDCEPVKSFLNSPNEENLKLCDLLIRGKAANNAALSSIAVPKCLDRALIQKLLTFSPQCMKLLGLVRSQKAGKFGVVSHGDFHMWNMSFGNDNKDVRFFDFQIVHYSSLACDIHHYLSQVTTAKTRRENQDEILGYYTEALAKECKKLGMTSIFSLDDITKEYVTRSPIAYLFGFGFIIPRFIEDQEAFNTSKDEKLDDTARIEALIKSGPEVLEAMQMSLDFLGFYKELGTFDIIENLLSQ